MFKIEVFYMIKSLFQYRFNFSRLSIDTYKIQVMMFLSHYFNRNGIFIQFNGLIDHKIRSINDSYTK